MPIPLDKIMEMLDQRAENNKTAEGRKNRYSLKWANVQHAELEEFVLYCNPYESSFHLSYTRGKRTCNEWLFYFGLEHRRFPERVRDALLNAVMSCREKARSKAERDAAAREARFEAFQSYMKESRAILSAPYVFIKSKFSWADEMDVHGAGVYTAEDFREIRRTIKRWRYPHTQGVGTNEEVKWESAKDVYSALTIHPVYDKAVYDFLVKTIGTDWGRLPDALHPGDEDEDYASEDDEYEEE